MLSAKFEGVIYPKIEKNPVRGICWGKGKMRPSNPQLFGAKQPQNKEKSPYSRRIRGLALVRREGFEPSWDCSQTDFEGENE